MANHERVATARELDACLRALVAVGRRADAEIAVRLAEMKARGLFRVLGYSRITDYAEWELEVSKAKARALIEVAAKLPGLPKIAEEFAEGRLDWTKARQIVRVATPENEEHWLHEAERLSVRGLESAVARERGEPPTVRVTLELTPEEAAILDAAVRRLREERGEAVPVGPAVVEQLRRA